MNDIYLSLYSAFDWGETEYKLVRNWTPRAERVAREEQVAREEKIAKEQENQKLSASDSLQYHQEDNQVIEEEDVLPLPVSRSVVFEVSF